MNGLNEVRKMLSEARHRPHGWLVANTETVTNLHALVEQMADSIEELTTVATNMSLAIKINLTPDQIRFLPGMAGALQQFDAAWKASRDLSATAESVVASDTAITDTEFLAAVHLVVDAIKNEGRNAAHHRKVMNEHRNQWPTLWKALDQLVMAHALRIN